MKISTTGNSSGQNWYGLNYTVKVPFSWTVTFETVDWEIWRVSVTTSNGVTESIILKQKQENPTIIIHKKLFHKYGWHFICNNASVEDEEKD